MGISLAEAKSWNPWPKPIVINNPFLQVTFSPPWPPYTDKWTKFTESGSGVWDRVSTYCNQLTVLLIGGQLHMNPYMCSSPIVLIAVDPSTKKFFNQCK